MKSITTACKQVRRTPYQALVAVLILTLTFFAVAVFALILGGSHLVLKYFESSPQAIAFFEKGKDLSQEDLSRIKLKLETTGKLAKFEYVSTKQAEQIHKDKNKNDPMLNELVDYKILPSSIEISATEISSLGELKAILAGEPLVKDIVFYEDIVGQLQTWIQNIRYLGIGMIGFLVLLSVLILMVIIGLKIKNSRKEIEIMRLLGASAWYIQAPFLVEGMIYGIVGAFFGWLGAFTALQYSTPFIVQWLNGIIAMPVDTMILLMLLGVMVVFGLVLGAFSSLMAVRRFLRV